MAALLAYLMTVIIAYLLTRYVLIRENEDADILLVILTLIPVFNLLLIMGMSYGIIMNSDPKKANKFFLIKRK